MRKLTRAVSALAVAAAAATAVTLGSGPAQADDGSWDGCPSGAVCIYGEGVHDNLTTPTNVYWSYGAHNLSGQYNWHWVLNNQTGGAHAHLCLGSNGANCNYDLPADVAVWANLTPVNSITLDRP